MTEFGLAILRINLPEAVLHSKVLWRCIQERLVESPLEDSTQLTPVSNEKIVTMNTMVAGFTNTDFWSLCAQFIFHRLTSNISPGVPNQMLPGSVLRIILITTWLNNSARSLCAIIWTHTRTLATSCIFTSLAGFEGDVKALWGAWYGKLHLARP